MKFTFKKTIGGVDLEITQDVKDVKELIRNISFFSELPTVGPNGETDLVFCHRTTSKGDYYSLVSKSANQEFQLGQHREGDTLFPKGWAPLYNPNNQSNESVSAPNNQQNYNGSYSPSQNNNQQNYNSGASNNSSQNYNTSTPNNAPIPPNNNVQNVLNNYLNRGNK